MKREAKPQKLKIEENNSNSLSYDEFPFTYITIIIYYFNIKYNN